MTTGVFGVPKGAVLFEMDGIQYEVRENLGVDERGISRFVARQRIGEQTKEKVLLSAVGGSSSLPITKLLRARAKLEEQVRLAKHLEHPGVHRVHGLKKTEGTWYVITDYPRGNTLSTLINLVGECRHWYTPQFTMYIGARVADVLEHAHAAKDEQGRPLNIVHRSIDPDHIYLEWNGMIRVSDFGLSLSALPGRIPSTVRRLNGDGFYSSPEMILGKRVDARADLFSLGMTLLELSTGKNLLDATDSLTAEVKASLSATKLRRVKRSIKRARLSKGSRLLEDAIWRAATYTEADVERATDKLPEGLRMTLHKLLHPAPSKRYQTARELGVDLRHWLGEMAFSPDDAIREVTRVMNEAGGYMANTGLDSAPPGRRGHEVTTAK
ncbi:Protein kinase domain-containing protein [Stigmatella aurantiaca]|uniref:non-specific serine/threonine protein kinase n=1 Tax=Stigmatella aurantiaca TaxID=41 RepID=A0A1H7U2Z4_STIAU|nr:protein kinase [Stigmatella aurantiaca]SEL91351.1 Protein kinase domain-containing protein [Stigmatella aurantiaca]